MADFIVQGRAISIDGGSIHFKNNIIKCESRGNMLVIKIEQDVPECPKCHSLHLTNMAGRFGHGKCCINNIPFGKGSYQRIPANEEHGSFDFEDGAYY